MSNISKIKKSRIIYLCILLALVAGLSIFTIYAQPARKGQINSGAAILTANAESNMESNAESAVLTPDDHIGIEPMSWWGGIGGAIIGVIEAQRQEALTKVGVVHAGDYNTVVADGSFTNKAIGYTANDFFPQHQMWSASNSGFTTTMSGVRSMWSNTNVNGWYRFRGYDPNTGFVSNESKIYLDTVKPQIQVRLNGSSVASGTVTTSSSAVISVLGSDDASGVNTYWYTMNGYGGTYYQCYSSSTFSGDGAYTFYCVDRAGNVSDTVTVTKDTTAPTARAYNGSSQISNGAIVYAASARFEASDSTTGVAGIYIRTPGSSSYTNYGTAATLSTEGLYYYYARDNAGNQSSTYTFTIDRTAPTVQLYSGTTAVSTNYYSAASYIRFTASDANGATCYMKKDSGSYAVYTSGTNVTAEGVYSFYAVDPAGNSTSTYTITLDRTAPVESLYAGTTIVSSGKITNASYVSYTATDNLALNVLYVLKPGASSYVSFASGTQFTADGWYYFYATDKSGNTSSTVSILLDRTKPVATIYAGTSIVANGTFTNSSSVSFGASDATSGVSAMYVKLPGMSNYISYVTGTPFTTEGIYYFYTTDAAGNTGDTVNVTLDVTKPTGTLSANGVTVTSGSFTNKAFSYTATDSLSGLSKCEIKRPNGVWETYTSGTSIAATSANGLYVFRTTDRAGNVSDEIGINLVTVAPTLTIYAGTTVVPSGIFTNKGYVSFTANASNGATASLFVKLPGSTEFIAYIAGTSLYPEGTYYFYAADNAGNISSTVNVTLDITAPLGTVKSGASVISNDGYTNKAFSYTGTDSLSGISKLEIKRPGGAWETYAAGTEIQSDAASGWYVFRSTDKAGNISDESRVCLMTTLPDILIYAGDSIIASGTYTNESYISFKVSDAISGTTNLYVRMPDSDEFTLYIAGTPLSREGTYFVYASDAAGNLSDELSITLDVSKPVGTIKSGGVNMSNNGYTNKSFSYTATDALSGVVKLEIKRPNGVWETYTAGAEIPATVGGWYAFRSIDKTGNISEESLVCLITVTPGVTLYANEQPVDNGTYTNLARISMSASGDYVKTCFVKLPNAAGFISYSQFYSFTAVGRYEFYAEDLAGGTSDIFVVIIDRTAKTAKVNGINGGIVNGDASVTWENGDLLTRAPIVSVTINGKAYTNGATIHTIDGGIYFVETTDAAGNTWNTSFAAKRTEVLSNTLNKQYFETVDGAGNSYAFESYADALAFAKVRENSLVRTNVWNGATWDGGIAMDNLDSVNAKNGTYYIYKKSGDKNTEVAYFTLERLNAVIAEYASETVSAHYWWQKAPAQIYNGNDLYALTADRTYVGNSAQFAGHASYLIDGEAYSGLIYSVEGVHILTVFDDFGNSYEYTLIIIRKSSDIFYTLGEGMGNRVTFDRSYFFNDIVTINIEDEYDEYAMFNVYAENGKLLACLSLGDTFTFDKSGKYTVQAVNHFGLSQVFTLIVSLDAPKTQIAENTTDKKLEIAITKSADAHSHLQTLEIYKSTDGGKTWVLITMDDYGNAVSLNRLKYEFRTTGLYKVVLTDEFRAGIDAVTAQFDYTQAKPDGTLVGVQNNGHTSGTVSFTWTDEAVVRLEKDGVEIPYTSGQKLTVDGSYVLTFENYDGYKAVYSFVIDTVAPIISTSEAINKSAVNSDILVFWSEENLTAVLYKNGKLIGEYNNGTKLTENGTYRIVVSDAAKNTTEISFVIDQTVDYTINVNDKGLANSVTVHAEEELEAVLTKDGEVIAYTFGDSITAEGQYSLKLTDEFGNREEISFTIVNSLAQKFEFNFDDMPGFEKVTVNGEDKRLNYGTLELKADGVYEVGVIVNGISYNFTVTIDTTAPTIVLNGVENGGTTKGAVTLSDNSEEAEVKVFFNGKEIEYELGGKLSQTGKYRVVVQDQCGNVTEYTFEIVPSVNGGVIALIVIAVIALIGVGVFLFLKKTKKI